jgi:hypothetical protein
MTCNLARDRHSQEGSAVDNRSAPNALSWLTALTCDWAGRSGL